MAGTHSTPEQQFLEITKEAGPLTEAEIEAVYNQLGPVKIEILLGEWKGGSFSTGHPADAELRNMNWAGKTFHSTEQVDPIVIYQNGERVCDENWGHACLRSVVFRGVLSSAMIYDNYPIIDHFRYVNDNLIAGAMDTKSFGEAGTYYFFLHK
ncbi:hypothetical protein F1880_001932 [Penicillium rolfsii]|nr:hypothetical protein F1880_001932 [Penicillium rolfsii]